MHGRVMREYAACGVHLGHDNSAGCKHKLNKLQVLYRLGPHQLSLNPALHDNHFHGYTIKKVDFAGDSLPSLHKAAIAWDQSPMVDDIRPDRK